MVDACGACRHRNCRSGTEYLVSGSEAFDQITSSGKPAPARGLNDVYWLVNSGGQGLARSVADLEGNREIDDALHGVERHLCNHGQGFIGDLDYQLIVDLKKDFRSEVFLLEMCGKLNHRLLDDVSRRTLDGCIESHSLPRLPLPGAASMELWQVSPPPENRGRVAGVASVLDNPSHEGPDVVSIYRLPLCAMCDDIDDLADEVYVTVIHEVAHAAGIDDDRLHELGWG